MRNIKFKKLMALLVVVMLSLTAMAGCGTSDMGYMSLYMDMSKVKEYTFTGDFSFEIDPGAMYAGYYGYYTPEDIPEPISVYARLSGSSAVAGDGLYGDFRINYGINDKKMPHELNLIVTGGESLQFYVPVPDILDAASIAYEFSDAYSTHSEEMETKILDGLTKELAGYDYLMFDYFEMLEENMPMPITPVPGVSGGIDDYLTSTGAAAADAAGMSSAIELYRAGVELNDLFFTQLTNMFNGFESGMTKSAPGGFAFEITPENAVPFADNFVKYLSGHKDAVYNGVLKILEGMLTVVYDVEPTAGELYSELITALKEGKQEFYDGIDYIAEQYNSIRDYDKELMKLTFKGSYIKDTVSKTGSGYSDVFDMNINYQGEKLLSMKWNININPGPVAMKSVDAQNPVGLEDLGAIFEKVENEANPVTSIAVSWWNGDAESWTSMDITRAEGGDWSSTERINDNGTLYLPVRDICEAFGEEVEWDNTAKKAYVVREGVKTEMEGRLEYSTLFVKIRDFEKLGYTVEYVYEKEWQEHMVTIIK